ncbi:MAG TPA: hypothetical protein VKA82_15130, partial [Rubrobacter sp.]|nr:hypothetical protein [Rubrobacter sp.]
ESRELQETQAAVRGSLRSLLQVTFLFVHPTAPLYEFRLSPRFSSPLGRISVHFAIWGIRTLHAHTDDPLGGMSIECTNGQATVARASRIEQPEGGLRRSEWCQ